jgi:hypothetical protein
MALQRQREAQGGLLTLPGRLVNGRYSVLARDSSTKQTPACATSQPPGLPYAAKPPLPQDAKDHAGRAGLDGEAGAKWSLSEDHVSARWVPGLRGSRVLLQTSRIYLSGGVGQNE